MSVDKKISDKVVNRKALRAWLEKTFNIRQHQTKPDEVFWDCPFCDPFKKHHDFTFNIEKLQGSCWRGASPKCDHGFNIYSLIAEFYGIDYEKAREFVESNFVDADTIRRVRRLITGLLEKGNRMIPSLGYEFASEWPPTQSLVEPASPGAQVAREWLLNTRKMPPEIIEMIGPRYLGQVADGHWRVYSDRVFFPISSAGSSAWLAYRVGNDDSRPKTMNPPGAVLSKLMFLYDFYTESPNPVLICEGLFDALRLFVYGANATCVFGTNISDIQIDMLNRLPCQEVVVCLDGDDAGRTRTPAMVEKLLDFYLGQVSVMSLEHGDPDELSFSDYERLYNQRVVWTKSTVGALVDRIRKLRPAEGDHDGK